MKLVDFLTKRASFTSAWLLQIGSQEAAYAAFAQEASRHIRIVT